MSGPIDVYWCAIGVCMGIVPTFFFKHCKKVQLIIGMYISVH